LRSHGALRSATVTSAALLLRFLALCVARQVPPDLFIAHRFFFEPGKFYLSEPQRGGKWRFA
jgi:hypothetical protein